MNDEFVRRLADNPRVMFDGDEAFKAAVAQRFTFESGDCWHGFASCIADAVQVVERETLAGR